MTKDLSGLETISGRAKSRISRRPRIGVLLGEKGNSFWFELKQYLEEFAKAGGLEIHFFWPPASNMLPGQLSVFIEMITLDFDLIIINPLSRGNLLTGIVTAGRKNIPVLDVGAKTDPDLIPSKTCFYFPVRTVDFSLQGVMGAEYIIRKIKNRRNKGVVVIEGRAEARQSRERSQGAVDSFVKEKSIRLVARKAADFERRKAEKLAERLLLEDSEIGAFFCANDIMALGVAETVRKLNRKKGVIIVGVDLIQKARESLRAGLIDASVAFSTASVAQTVLESARKVLAGQSVSKDYQVKSTLVDRRGLDSWEKGKP
jgi:ABC-type sugar transport system substrate-binding protein